MDVVCRVCLSKKYLLSMFGGKRKPERDAMRNIISDTLGNKIEERDKISTVVCINCCIHAFNFYKFRQVATISEHKLKLEHNVSTQSEAVNEITAPKTRQLIQDLELWLEKKKKLCSNVKDDGRNHKTHTFVDRTTQSDVVSYESCTTQCEVTYKNCTTQTEVFSAKCIENSMQTESGYYEHSTTQTEDFLQPPNELNSDKDLTARKRRSGALTPKSRGSKRIKNTGTVKTENLVVEQNNDHLQLHLNSVPRPISLELPPLLPLRSSKRVKNTGTIKTENLVVEQNNDYLQLQKSTVDLNSLPRPINANQCLELPPPLVPLNSELTLNASNPFGNNLLAICTNIKPTFNVCPNSAAVDNRLSPTSSSLMSVKTKTTHVEICKFCDKPMYKKRDMKRHLYKAHRQCSLCKQKFRSANMAYSHKCIFKEQPEVSLMQLDTDPILKEKYKDIFEYLKQFQKKTVKVDKFRMRSKSLSSLDYILMSKQKFEVVRNDKATQTTFPYPIYSFIKKEIKDDILHHKMSVLSPGKF